MKISKAFISVLFLGLIAIGAGLLYTMYQKELDRQSTLNDTLNSTSALLPPIQANITKAQADLAAAQAKVAAAQANLQAYKAKFPTPPPVAAIQSIDYGEKLFILAANNTLNLTEFSASGPDKVTIDKIAYQKTVMVIKVSGAIERINDFVGNLETGTAYLTATIDSVDITFYTEFDTELGAVPPPDATITISLMALEG
ncbi:hypothetical protein Dform_01295 [Dehalogenimonas formicexedens]|uniref:Uncharacterized protein n=1 Tax=Dehalogenimonas formicexedens TaxID=1839801 RepID=A0A1P8F864_9CHLR|nr:hypothetical protein [Dehalogenimonas formicexedens]APV44623.1 hypothetical protein Dform_01295 [Dehalogenimonas formicexedens]